MDKTRRNEIMAVVRRSPLFSTVDPASLEELLTHCPTRVVKSGQVIFSQGDPAIQFYIILNGRVKLYLMSAKGDEQILHNYHAGDSFGEAAVWVAISYPAYAEAQQPSELLIISDEHLKAAITANPELAFGMMAGLSRKLREFNKLIEQLSLQEVPERLASILIEMSRESNSCEIQLSQTKRELAAQIGTVAETLSRAFRKLRQNKLIEVDGARIKILDPDRLEEMIGE